MTAPAAEDAGPATRPARPTIHDFQIGTPYSTSFVASFFGYTRSWAVLCCDDGRFPNAFKPKGGNYWLIPGQDVRAMYGEELIEKDRAALAAAVPTPLERRREAEAALQRLGQLDAPAAKPAKKRRPAKGVR